MNNSDLYHLFHLLIATVIEDVAKGIKLCKLVTKVWRGKCHIKGRAERSMKIPWKTIPLIPFFLFLLLL